jgi:hypothetical protein
LFGSVQRDGVRGAPIIRASDVGLLEVTRAPQRVGERGGQGAVTRSDGIAAYRLVFGLLTLAAIGTQLLDLAGKGVLDPLHYFSYFTIDSNLFAAAVFLYLAARRGQARTRTIELVRGAAAVYMTITGVVFTLLLANTDVDTAIAWVNDVVHSLMPIVVVADWLLDPPQHRISYRTAESWVVPPLIWLVYTLVKGPIVGKYPYPFLDPGPNGYGSVAITCVAILLTMLLVSGALIWAARAAGDGRTQVA